MHPPGTSRLWFHAAILVLRAERPGRRRRGYRLQIRVDGARGMVLTISRARLAGTSIRDPRQCRTIPYDSAGDSGSQIARDRGSRCGDPHIIILF